MDYTSKSENVAMITGNVASDLSAHRIAIGYSLDDLAIATGLTITEIIEAEKGLASMEHVERIKRVLR